VSTQELMQERFTEIERLAHGAGLDPYDVVFFNVPVGVIYEVASYGLPTRYSHWSFGRVYQYQKTQGEMGMSKIYELVLNNNPSYAFLDKNNANTTNLLVAAHVYAHSDVFKNNVMFRECGETKMIEHAKRHADMIDQYRKDFGDDEVDMWLDIALALERHVDVYKGLKRKRYPKRHVEYEEREVTEWEDIVHHERDPLIKKVLKGIYLPPHPEKDLLWFMTEYANLESWQQKIFEIVRRESYYFYPQFRTKIINEGWACLVGDSYVQTSHGYRKFKDIISDMPGEPLTVVTGVLDKNEKMQLQSISDYHETEPQVTTKIMTSKGISLEGAHDHRVIAAKNVCGESIIGDVNLVDLEVGDFIKMPIGQNVWASELVKCDFPKEINEDVARFLGFFLSEGRVVEKGIQITNKDEVLIEAFCSVCEKAFGVRPEVSPRKGDLDRYDCIIWCPPIVRFLEYIDVNLNYKSKEKEIPPVIMRSPKNVVAAFLSAYYAGDGGCYAGDGGCYNNKIILSTSSLRMTEQVGILLLNFGIDYGFSEKKKPGHTIIRMPPEEEWRERASKSLDELTPCNCDLLASAKEHQPPGSWWEDADNPFESDSNYHLTITGKPNVWAFAKYIGFYGSPKKEEYCKRILVNFVRNMDDEGVTAIAFGEIRSYRDQFNKNKYGENLWYVYAKVIGKSQGYDVLYDLTVPGTHHYLAQACINHNSYWHAELMRQYSYGNANDYGVTGIQHPLTSEEHLDFAAAHEKVVQAGIKIPLKIEVLNPETGKKEKRWNPNITANPRIFRIATRLNPYYLGFRMFRDIKERWDKYYEEGYYEDEWGKQIPVHINGDQKIREVMMEEDDISFMRNYLTEELAEELKLFSYGNTSDFDDNYGIQEDPDRHGIQEDSDEYDEGREGRDTQSIENKTIICRSKEIKNIIDGFAKGMNNYGVPEIVVRRVDETGLLRLEHVVNDKTNVDIGYAKYVLKYIWKAWGGRVVEMVRKDKDRTWIMTYDGIQFDIDHQTTDYPETIEKDAPPSSW